MAAKKYAKLSDAELLAEIGEYAAQVAHATEQRNLRIAAAIARGLPQRTVGDAAGITHTAVQYIVKRSAE